MKAMFRELQCRSSKPCGYYVRKVYGLIDWLATSPKP